MTQRLTDLTFEEQLRNLGRDCLRALVELGGRQICDRMRHFEEAELRQAPAASHRAPRGMEYVGDDRS